VLCDIDNLKRVNDQGGHEAGDRALVAAAAALVEAAARHPDAIVGRFGGDEFCVLLPTGTAADARQVALDAVHRLDAKGGARISCGVAARGDDLRTSADLLRAADEAQYSAKRAGNGLDVVVAGAGVEQPPSESQDRAFRAPQGDAALARDLLDLIRKQNGASAEDKLERVRARLERTACR
jgi:diguanylate cyclase (GGDEF)-like protein